VLRGRGLAGRDPVDHEHDEEDKCQILQPEQDDLESFTDLQPAIAHPAHQGDEDHPGRGDQEGALGQLVLAEHQPEVDAADLGQVGEHDDAGHSHAPPPHPADPWSEGLGRPGEGGAAVRDLAVQLLVGGRDEQHRDERDDERDRRLGTDGQHDEPEGGHQRVDGRRGRESDDDGPGQAEGADSEPFATRRRD
jgi:hypothetical protein